MAKGKVKMVKKTTEQIKAGIKITEEQIEKLRVGLAAGQVWDYASGAIPVDTEIFGVLTNLRPYNKGKIHNELITLDNGDRDFNLWSCSVLRSRFEELEIKIGDIIGIKYLGPKKGENFKKPYHNFAVSKL